MPNSKYGWIDDAIRSAQDRGAIPFITVVPVTPEFLRDAAGPVDVMVGEAAAKDIAKAVRRWQAEDADAED